MCSSAGLRHHDSHWDSRITFTLFQILRLIVDHIDGSPRFFSTAVPNSSGCNKSQYQQASIPVIVQPSALFPSIHVSCMAPECTAISLDVVRLVRCTRCQSSALELNSVGHQYAWFSDSSHNITNMFPIQKFFHQVCGIDCASDLLDPELLVFLLLCSHKNFVSICLIAPLPLRRASPRAVAASVQIRTWASYPNSRIVLANPMASFARRTMRWYTDSALLSDTTSCFDDQVAKVC